MLEDNDEEGSPMWHSIADDDEMFLYRTHNGHWVFSTDKNARRNPMSSAQKLISTAPFELGTMPTAVDRWHAESHSKGTSYVAAGKKYFNRDVRRDAHTVQVWQSMKILILAEIV